MSGTTALFKLFESLMVKHRDGEALSPKVWSDDDQDWVDNDNWYSRRTTEELNQDLIDLLSSW